MSTSICPVTKESATQPVFEQFATACTSKAGRGKKDWLAMFEKRTGWQCLKKGLAGNV